MPKTIEIRPEQASAVEGQRRSQTRERSTARRTTAGATSGVIVHATRSRAIWSREAASDGLDFACLCQHLVDLPVRDQHSAGGVGKHVLAGHPAYALEDYRRVCLKRGQMVASPASRL